MVKSVKVIIGLTGGIGSGKSTIAEFFHQLGIESVDADIVAREVVAIGTPALQVIAQHFGSEILTPEGELDRAALRQLVFSNPDHKAWLNALLHPLIRKRIIEQLNTTTSPYCLLIAPLLIENGLDKLVNRVLVIDVSEETQIQRATKRDTNSTAEIKRIIASQASREQRLSKADDVINNETSELMAVKNKVDTLHQRYLALTNN